MVNELTKASNKLNKNLRIYSYRGHNHLKLTGFKGLKKIMLACNVDGRWYTSQFVKKGQFPLIDKLSICWSLLKPAFLGYKVWYARHKPKAKDGNNKRKNNK